MKKIPLRNPLKRFKNRAIAATAVAAAGLLLAAAACGSDAATPSPGVTVPATPDAQATITALARRAEVGTPTPTIVPAADRTVAVAFADGHRALSQRWEAFHSEFDGWRQGLAQCTPGAVQSSLAEFAGNFAQITESARALPRSAVIRNLADDLIGAAEQEETALRLLRDNWQPGTINNAPSAAVVDESNPDTSENSGVQANNSNFGGGGSSFEQVAAARSQAALLRRSVADSLIDRSRRTDASSRAEIDTFSDLLQELDTTWDQFHIDYDELRTQVVDLSASEAAARLGAIVAQFTDIVSAVRALPYGDATLHITQILSQAAQEEDRSLRRLRGAVQNSGDSTETSASDEAEGSEASSGGAETGVETSLYDAFDSQIAISNASREEARRSLTLVKEDISPETKTAVADFTEQYDTLTLDWNSFHSSYDEWRKTNGGCNRSQVMRDLGRFGVSFSEIAKETRNLPAATVLRPMGELLVEAAEREERALRDLGNTWQPYDTGVYVTLDQERAAANKLRRQVTVGLQELFERFGISP